jgi:hypothetical protein
MTSRFSELAIDCHDTARIAKFWCDVLDYRITDQDGDLIEIGDGSFSREALRANPIAPVIVFAKVPESKTVKNRVHIDVSPVDRTQEEEVERIEALGARRIDIGQGNVHWVVMADPEGNEFCVLRSLSPDT